MDEGYFKQITRDCLGYALMDKYIPNWKELPENELQQIIDELKSDVQNNR